MKGTYRKDIYYTNTQTAGRGNSDSSLTVRPIPLPIVITIIIIIIIIIVIHIYIYIYVYIYNLVDFGGFDSSIILTQRGGIQGWHSHVHRGLPGKLESSNVSRAQC